MFNGRPTCDEKWSGTDGQIVKCERYAVVSVDGVAYCSEHVKYADVTDK